MPYAHPSGCPPRALDCANDGEGQALALRKREAFFFIVARGPVPRDRCMARETLSHARVASEGPRPTMKGTVFYRSAGACPPRSMHGEGNPLAGACGIRGPSPYGEGAAFFHRDVERIMKSPLIIRREIHP